MALTETGDLTITETELAEARAADPTLAWLIDRDGTCTLVDVDDPSRYTIPGAWPRYLGRAAASHSKADEPPVDAAARLGRLIRASIGRPPATDAEHMPGYTPAYVPPYDPGEHTVADVNDYLAGAEPAERERVLALEEAGKARKTILGRWQS